MAFERHSPRPAAAHRARPHSGSGSFSRAPRPLPPSRNQNVKQWPQVGETVVVHADKVLDYGVFCSLVEFPGATGFVHISQVASSWIKNIRNYVREGQMRAALVQKIDFEKLQIDLSFTKVSERQQRVRIDEYKQLKRNQKLVEQMAKSKGKTMEEGWKEIAEPLIAHYETLAQAFEAISLEGKSAVEGVDAKWVEIVADVVQKNIKAPEKAVKGILSISSHAPNGIELIKSALMEGMKGAKNAMIQYSYLGSGKYHIKVVSFDYKVAEKALAQVQEKIQKMIGNNGSYSFARQEAK
jgi:translation initiation factor 2 subunit 1